MLLGKTVFGILVVSIAISAAVGFVNLRAPYAKNLNAHFDGVNNGVYSFSGSVDIIYRNPQAWRDFGYKDGNFYFFNQYWENQVGNTFTFAGVSAKLVDISITLDGHFQSHDHLLFTVKLQPV